MGVLRGWKGMRFPCGNAIPFIHADLGKEAILGLHELDKRLTEQVSETSVPAVEDGDG